MKTSRKPHASRGSDKSNGDDRVVKVIRVFASGRVSAVGRPPKGWTDKGRANDAAAAPADKPAERVKDPRKVAAGKARAEKARLAREAAASAPVAKKPAAKKPAAKKTAKVKKKAKASPFPGVAKKPAAVKRGGARAGSGPKPKNGGPMKVAAFRLTPDQIKKLDKLGGVSFIRERIDRAAVPAA